jgi:hypothetical protein
MRHGWLLPDDGAQRAASNSVNSSSCDSGSPDIARGDHRSTNSESIGRSGERTSLPLTRAIFSNLS